MKAYKITDIKTFYGYLEILIGNFKDTKTATKYIDKALRDKIFLAVTQVNGCRHCTYIHSRNAIKNGVSEKELKMLLSGDFDTLSKNEAKIILFSQHYAESRGKYDVSAYLSMEETLGKAKLLAVMGIIRKIMIGNTHGIAMDLLKMRLEGNVNDESRFKDEVGIFFGIFIMVPYLIVKHLFRKYLN